MAEIEAELMMPEFPEALGYLWTAYLRLRNSKGTTDMGAPRPIEWPDYDAFSRRSGISLAPWEIEILEGIDGLFRRRDETPSKPAAIRPMSEQLFDAVFA